MTLSTIYVLHLGNFTLTLLSRLVPILLLAATTSYSAERIEHVTTSSVDINIEKKLNPISLLMSPVSGLRAGDYNQEIAIAYFEIRIIDGIARQIAFRMTKDNPSQGTAHGTYNPDAEFVYGLTSQGMSRDDHKSIDSYETNEGEVWFVTIEKQLSKSGHISIGFNSGTHVKADIYRITMEAAIYNE